jgi:hypothetical protein
VPTDTRGAKDGRAITFEAGEKIDMIVTANVEKLSRVDGVFTQKEEGKACISLANDTEPTGHGMIADGVLSLDS